MGGCLSLFGFTVGFVGRILFALLASSLGISAWVGAGVGNQSSGFGGTGASSEREWRICVDAGGGFVQGIGRTHLHGCTGNGDCFGGVAWGGICFFCFGRRGGGNESGNVPVYQKNGRRLENG